MKPIVKHKSDQIVEHSPTCGLAELILTGADYKPFSIAYFTDILPTHPHFHETFDEIYLVITGSVQLRMYDPADGSFMSVSLGPNELCVIPKLTHHGIAEASAQNEVFVLAAPPFHMDDEHLSDKLPDFAAGAA